MNEELINTLAGIVAASAPLMIASQGELLTERSGVVNLSLDGSILLAAMFAFRVSMDTGRIELGILSAMLVGMLVALVVMSASVFLKVNQVAVGFVLTILCADLSTFLGRNYTGLAAAEVEIPYLAIPVLEDIPVLGPIFFQHNAMVYFSLLLVVFVWWWLYRTGPGLALRALGDKPAAAYVRGTKVQLWRFIYVGLGGALVGLGGAAFSLDVQLGWREDLTLGQGWIALAIVIFGAWKPFRVMAGVFLIVGLRAFALFLQQEAQLDLSIHIINMVPWLLMLLTLMFAASGAVNYVVRILPPSWQGPARQLLRSDPPAALGTAFEKGN
jgi:simple sugar transport system permease protein